MKVYGVHSEFFDNGKVTCYMREYEVNELPKNVSIQTARSDRYTDYFTSKSEAEKFVDDTRKA